MVAWILAILGLGALLAGVVVLIVGGLLLGPLIVWLSWNVLGLGPAVGAAKLGFWGLVLAAVFLVSGFALRVVIVAVVFLVDPAWFHRSAELHWPAPTLRNFVAICLLLALAGASSHPSGKGKRSRADWDSAERV